MRYLLLFALLAQCAVMNAQMEQKYNTQNPDLPEWVQLMYDDDPDPGAVIAAYESFYSTNEFQKNTHTQYYKRWIRQIVRERIPLDPAQRASYQQDQKKYLEDKAKSAGGGNVWSSIGPFDWDHDAASKSYACGAAHIYTVEQSLTNTDIVYAGSANAGVWKSIDKGLNWTHTTKDMTISAVVSLEIDHSNANVVYFGGSGDLYKTTDGGSSWNSIGDAAFQTLDHSIRDIVMHPTNAQIFFICSDEGLFRTADGGANFTLVQSGIWQELEFHPTNNNTLYAILQTGDVTQFWRSTNGGTSFTQMTTGWPLPASPDEQKRTEIAVSPASPNTVYALCTGAVNGGSGLFGIYKSIDQGSSWTFSCCGPQPGGAPSASNMNLMAWSDQGLDDGGQYYYDLALSVDPTDADIVTVCGVNRWVSTDGGSTFTCPAKWSHSSKVDYVHADIHDMRYFGSDIWLACDGGIFYSNDAQATYERRMYGISGTDFWGFGQGGWDGADVMLGGTYHNGTLLKDNSVYLNDWISTDGGDGYRGYVDPHDDRKAISDYGGKILSGDRAVANGSFNWDKRPNASYIIGASSEIAWHPNEIFSAYVGKDTSLWFTTDQGGSFTKLHDFSGNVTNIEVALSDPNTIYVCTYPGWWDTKRIYRSTDGGTNWTDITPPSGILGGNTWVPYDIAVSGTDPQTIWLARTSQYGSYPNINGNVIYKSTDGGTNWTNITDANLNNEWPTCISHQMGSNGALYVGTRNTVFYNDDALANWTMYNNGLPASITSVKLLPQYRLGKLRSGTDQSVWEADLYAPSPPLANMAADRRSVNCFSPDVQFLDYSILNENGATWAWTFPGGTPSSSNARDPLVSYTTAGSYDVTLTVTDVNGTHMRTFTDFISVTSSDVATPFVEDVESGQAVPLGWALENPDDGTTWGTVNLSNGANCGPSTCWRMDHYYYNAAGQEDRLISPLINLAGSAGTRLMFDHAYAPYSATLFDGFRVEVSADCGSSWTVVFDSSGTALATAPTLASPWEPGNCSDWETNDIDISAYDGQVILIRFVAINGYGNRFYFDNVAVLNNGVLVDVKVFLEGPYDQNNGIMQDDLRMASLIPNDEPFTTLGFAQVGGGGGETLQTGVLDITGDDAIVDWVLIEVRDAIAPSNIIATRSALLQRDGDVVAMDGVSPIAIEVSAGNHYVSVRHRNHLGCMTASTLSLSATATTVDFINGISTFGIDAQKNISGVDVLWSGNTVVDNELKYTGLNNDRDPILQAIGGVVPTATVSGYRVEDANLDGITKYTGLNNDRDPILQNIGGVVPTAIRQEQLP